MSKQTRWMKVLVLFLAGLMAVFPAFTQVAVAQTAPAQTKPLPTQKAGVILPQGEELSDAELQEAEGEYGPIITAVASGIVGGTLNAGLELADQLYDGKGIKGRKIAISFAQGFGLGVIGSPLVGAASRGLAIARSGLASALRWSARAARTVGPAAISSGSRIINRFNRYIGGSVVRLFSKK
jgi:hypothetical protein